MKLPTLISARILITAVSLTSFASYAEEKTAEQRNVNQQQRIEQGLENGSLTTREASKLERAESRANAVQAHAMRDGVVTDQEAARIDKTQDAASKKIYEQKHDAQLGNPDSRSSQRMQADVQRNVNQQERIQKGIETGALTTKETAQLQRNQAQAERREARAGRDGHVGAVEQAKVQAKESRDSKRIYRKKHN